LSVSHYDNIEKAKELVQFGASPRRYVCEVHREVWDLIEKNIESEQNKQQALDLLAEAYWLSKRMSDRLKELKETAQFDGNDALTDADFRSRIQQRAERVNALKTYKSVQIQTIDFCNRSCAWCPNKDLNKSPETKMSQKTLSRILRQLLDYNYTGAVHPYLMAEPLEDNRILAILKEIKEYLPDARVKIATNGDKLKYSEDVQGLLDAGCDSIHVNHYDDLNEYKLRDKDFEGVTHFGRGYLKPTFFNRAGKVKFIPSKIQTKGCSYFLNKLYFRHNGDLILCCSDYDYEVVFGNINEQSLPNILAGELYRKYYYAHKNGEAKTGGLKLCQDCNHI